MKKKRIIQKYLIIIYTYKLNTQLSFTFIICINQLNYLKIF